VDEVYVRRDLYKGKYKPDKAAYEKYDYIHCKELIIVI
jgi:hypothetical protein